MGKNKDYSLEILFKLITAAIVAAIYGIYKAYKHYKLKKEKESTLAGLEVEKQIYSKMLDKKHYLHSLDCFEFEKKIAELFKTQGYKDIKVTSRTNDGGLDIIMWDDMNNKYAVQVKKYAEYNKVSRPEIQKLVGSAQGFRVNRMKFLTLGYFTKQAIDYAQQNNVELINGDELIDMFSDIEDEKDIAIEGTSIL